MGSVVKQPLSVLVLIHTPQNDVLLLERAGHKGLWQSVTGSREDSEPLLQVAQREVREETGIEATEGDFIDWKLTNIFEIFPVWRHRYAPGVTHNAEHVFSLQLASRRDIQLAPNEHVAHQWLPWREAATLCFSWTNRDAVLMLPMRTN